MLQLYKEKPVTISMMNRRRMVNVEFCNVSMNLKFCQFKLFHNYLMNKLRGVNSETKDMNLLSRRIPVLFTDISLCSFRIHINAERGERLPL